MEINQEIQNAYQVIQNGGIILYPTDTVWGIGCDATNPDAIKKIYALKHWKVRHTRMIPKFV